MFKHKFCLFMAIVMAFLVSSSLNIFAQGDEVTLPEISAQYTVDDGNDNIIFHEITVYSDGSRYEDIIELIEETIVEDARNPLARDGGGSTGTASKTYRHTVTGRNNSGTPATAEFSFEISYRYNTAYPGYSDNAMTYVYCRPVTPGFTTMEDVGRSENRAWVKYGEICGLRTEKYTYTVSYGQVSVVKS